jgi:hypothetical protein
MQRRTLRANPLNARLNPVNALLTRAGPSWNFQVNKSPRRCNSLSLSLVAPLRLGAGRGRFPLSKAARAVRSVAGAVCVSTWAASPPRHARRAWVGRPRRSNGGAAARGAGQKGGRQSLRGRGQGAARAEGGRALGARTRGEKRGSSNLGLGEGIKSCIKEALKYTKLKPRSAWQPLNRRRLAWEGGVATRLKGGRSRRPSCVLWPRQSN